MVSVFSLRLSAWLRNRRFRLQRRARQPSSSSDSLLACGTSAVRRDEAGRLSNR